jgi:multisubunit Na+/H+ antiporter MnhG subunit
VARTKRKTAKKWVNLSFQRWHIHILLDKVLFLRFLRHLHGRFWGIVGISVMMIGFSICFLIRPDMLHISTAFSHFGNDVRTAPYFAASVFFAAYGLWRWQRYLARTWKRAMPVTGLVTLTVIGLYIIALMPLSWGPVQYAVHMFGVALAYGSMLATVIMDGLLTRTSLRRGIRSWRLVRFISLILILTGGWLTLGSAEAVNWYQVSLLGETMLLAGYLSWIILKTYVGEGNRTILSRILKKIVLID